MATYKNHTLVKCFCGYPERRYLIYFGPFDLPGSCRGCAKTIREAKSIIDSFTSK